MWFVARSCETSFVQWCRLRKRAPCGRPSASGLSRKSIFCFWRRSRKGNYILRKCVFLWEHTKSLRAYGSCNVMVTSVLAQGYILRKCASLWVHLPRVFGAMAFAVIVTSDFTEKTPRSVADCAALVSVSVSLRVDFIQKFTILLLQTCEYICLNSFGTMPRTSASRR